MVRGHKSATFSTGWRGCVGDIAPGYPGRLANYADVSYSEFTVFAAFAPDRGIRLPVALHRGWLDTEILQSVVSFKKCEYTDENSWNIWAPSWSRPFWRVHRRRAVWINHESNGYSRQALRNDRDIERERSQWRQVWIASWTCDVNTTVRWELAPKNQGTLVRIRHSGLAAQI